jgi:hypothetical protein
LTPQKKIRRFAPDFSANTPKNSGASRREVSGKYPPKKSRRFAPEIF